MGPPIDLLIFAGSAADRREAEQALVATLRRSGKPPDEMCDLIEKSLAQALQRVARTSDAASTRAVKA